MAYNRYPAPEERSNRPLERSNQPQYASHEPAYYSEQPAMRTRFYRDKRNGKVFGVCAGIADYTGFDVSLVRVCFLAAMFMSGGGVIPFYFIAAMVTPTKPMSLEGGDREERQFWQGVRASPRRADIESYVTTENRSLAREIEQLR
jgi:phage shock protein C